MLTSPRCCVGSTARRHAVAFGVVSALAVAACSTGDDDTAETLPIAPVESSADSTTVAETDATTSPTSPDTTATTAPPSESTTAPETTTTTVASTTTTTEPLAIQELILRQDGLGSARFGAEPEGVIAYVTSILGGNTADTGWVAPDTFAACLGTVARKVDWGVLTLLFTDESRYVEGRRHFIAFEYGRVGEIGDAPVGLRTAGGVTLGSRVVDVLAEFPGSAVNEGESEVNIPDNFYVSDVFYGLLTGINQDDVVTVMFGGDGCGE